jgi:pimeloyl-ACP methyl ester carboxylesterase
VASVALDLGDPVGCHVSRTVGDCMSGILKSVPFEHQSRDQREFAVRDRQVTVDGISTQYLEAGTGSPLLLLHGYEQSATSWRWVIPALARTHRVLALSLPGHGDSAPAVGGYAPGRDLAPFVAGFLDTLGVGPLDVVGNSVGGAIALRVALADPVRVRTLTLVDSAGLGRDVNPLLVLAGLPVLGELATLLTRVPGGDLGRTTMSAAMLFAQPWRVPTEFVTEQHARGHRVGHLEEATAMARALFDLNGQREVLVDQLHTLMMPTLVIWGACDYVLPVYQAQAAVDRLPRGRLALFPDCGHLPHVECPDRFTAVLNEFLTEHRYPYRGAHRAPPLASVDPPPTGYEDRARGRPSGEVPLEWPCS